MDRRTTGDGLPARPGPRVFPGRAAAGLLAISLLYSDADYGVRRHAAFSLRPTARILRLRISHRCRCGLLRPPLAASGSDGVARQRLAVLGSYAGTRRVSPQ